jgi:hypothetical protein
LGPPAPISRVADGTFDTNWFVSNVAGAIIFAATPLGIARVVTNKTEGPEDKHGDYDRQESEAKQLDRNWAELVQELRVIGTGVQILFAFLLSIAFQARFARTTGFQRDVFLATLMLSGAAALTFIAPVAVHRFLFRLWVKDEVVNVTNFLALSGLVCLSLAMTGAILLVSDWVAGGSGAAICTTCAGVALFVGWFGFPMWLRHRTEAAEARQE